MGNLRDKLLEIADKWYTLGNQSTDPRDADDMRIGRIGVYMNCANVLYKFVRENLKD